MATAEARILTLVANLAAQVQERTLNGRRYLVAPATLIVPGVLNGSDGPGYYPPEENRRSVPDWNGVSLVAYHPLRNGVPVAAQDPEHEDWVWNESGLGFLKNAQDDGKLTAEAWFDYQLTENYDRKLPEHVRILPRLTSNRPIELSTGLFVDRDEQPGTCPRTGRSYTWVARNYRPDHLAVLPDQRGACSVEDGCGVVMNIAKKPTLLQAIKQLVDNWDDDGDGVEDGKASGTAAAPRTAGKSKEVKHPQAVESGSAEAASRIEKQTSNADGWVTLPNGVHVEIKDGKIVKGPDIAKKAMDKVETQHAKTMAAHDKVGAAIEKLQKLKEKHAKERSAKKTDNAGKHGNPQHGDTGKYLPHGSGSGKGEVHAAAVEGTGCECGGTCEKCKKMIKNSNPNHDEKGRFAEGPGGAHEATKAAHRLSKKAGEVALPGDTSASLQATWASKQALKKQSGMDSGTIPPSQAYMHDTAAVHHERAARLHEEASAATSDPKSQEAHKAAAKAHEVARQLHRSLVKQKPSTNLDHDNSNQGDPTMATATKLPEAERLGLVAKITANCKCQDGESKIINSLSDATLMRLNAMAEEDQGSEVESEVEPAPDEERRSPKKKLPPQFAKNMSDQEWLEAAPPRIRAAVTNAIKVERTAREQLISKIVANQSDAEKESYKKFLANKDLPELEMIAGLVPVPTRNRDEDLFDDSGSVAPVTANFLGAAGGAESGRAPSPTFNVGADPEMDPQYWVRELAKA